MRISGATISLLRFVFFVYINFWSKHRFEILIRIFGMGLSSGVSCLSFSQFVCICLFYAFDYQWMHMQNCLQLYSFHLSCRILPPETLSFHIWTTKICCQLCVIWNYLHLHHVHFLISWTVFMLWSLSDSWVSYLFFCFNRLPEISTASSQPRHFCNVVFRKRMRIWHHTIFGNIVL